jgi:hypothetical protein
MVSFIDPDLSSFAFSCDCFLKYALYINVWLFPFLQQHHVLLVRLRHPALHALCNRTHNEWHWLHRENSKQSASIALVNSRSTWYTMIRTNIISIKMFNCVC